MARTPLEAALTSVRYREASYAACTMLGLDPKETTSLAIVIEPTGGAKLVYEGRRRIPTEKVAEIARLIGGDQ
ncbi:hypothetical protein RB608_11795 [Nocardioides sp. LHD-245]|uniref:hypothetical protein n=1 Tax=Nocardioides sp. LHD-245 TaxID=3051387 RepID=UPI0027DFE2D8|nr:hypothetical protein [Nocardioides sp. LHD-245]